LDEDAPLSHFAPLIIHLIYSGKPLSCRLFPLLSRPARPSFQKGPADLEVFGGFLAKKGYYYYYYYYYYY
jgi:hypothetical protein